ncbi:hypothetical protein AB0I53_08945 [Saccharopolyspora sp. NPDC050389]|uniref:hypothetical protein n=1 Tax=Saccharopolyspora sp. NPDC050389 TaxID=3155516 RepID=UPI003411F28E
MAARSSLSPLHRRRRGMPELALARHTVGNVLVVCPEQKMTPETQALAMSVAADDEHEMVVVDLPVGVPVAAWDSVAELLPRRRRGVRLILGGRSREATALTGQWLSERIGRTVVAPDGAIFRGAGGTLFVHSGKGSGWVRFRPGRAPEWEAKRFPRPSWDSGATDPWPTSSVGMADPIPGGVWIHAAARDAESGEHWSRLVSGMPCQPEVLTVVLGCPGTPPLSLDDVSRFWRQLDDQVRAKVRFVQYGPVRLPQGETLGQAIADLLETRVVCYTGMPVGSTKAPDIYTVCADGGLGWHAFAREVGYLPRTDPAFRETPVLLSHRIPVGGVEQVAPAVYWYTPDAVLEVVQSGLWVRPPEGAQNAAAVRAEPWRADVNILAFDATDEKRAERMRLLAQDVLARLDPATRVRCRIVPASEVGGSEIRIVGPAQGELVAEAEPSAAQSSGQSAGQSAGNSSVTDTVRLPAVQDAVRTDIGGPAAVASPVAETPVDAGISLDTGAPVNDVVAGATEAPAAPAPASGAAASGAVAVDPGPAPGAAAPETAAPGIAAPGTAAPETAAPGTAAPGTAASGTAASGTAAARTEPRPETGPASAMTIRLESSPVPTIDEPPAPRSADTAPSAPEPTAPSATSAPKPAPAAEPAEPAKAGGGRAEAPKEPAEPRFQPTPEPAASALVADHGLTEERAWLRRTLSRDFDTMSHSISRILSEHPGFQGSDGRSSADVLTDAVAVRLHLSERGEAIDQALRTGENGPHVPFARCVVSGLTRLPSHRGATTFTASPTPQQWERYQQRRLVTDWSFIHALTEPSPDQQGEVDVLVWSMTARRTKLLEPGGTDEVDNRVVFVPGTSFKVLETTESGADGTRGRILLRELAESEVDESGRVDARPSLDELAITSLRRCVERWSSAQPRGAVGKSATHRFGWMPGLV